MSPPKHRVVVVVMVVVDSLDDMVRVVAVYVVLVTVGGVVRVVVVDEVVENGFLVVVVLVLVVVVVIRGHPRILAGSYAHVLNRFMWCEPSWHCTSPGCISQYPIRIGQHAGWMAHLFNAVFMYPFPT